MLTRFSHPLAGKWIKKKTPKNSFFRQFRHTALVARKRDSFLIICPDEILHVDAFVFFSVKQNVTAQYLISRFCPLVGVPLIHLVLGLVIKAEISIPLLKIMLRRTCPACKGPGNGDIHDTAAAGDRRWKFDLSDRLMERWQRFFKRPCSNNHSSFHESKQGYESIIPKMDLCR